MRKRKLPLIASACLLFICGLIILPKWWSSVGESRLQSRIEHKLLDELPELAGENWRVYMDGVQGIVHGTVSSPSLYRDAADLIANLSGDGAAAISGLESLQCALIVPHRSTLSLSVDDDSGKIIIAGEVPASAESALASALASAFPGSTLEKQIQLSSGLAGDAPWAGTLGEILPILVRSVGNLGLELDGRALDIRGRVASEPTRLEIQKMLLERLAGSIDYVRNGLTTLEGDLEQSFLTLEFTEVDTIVLHGRVHSKAARDQLVRGIEEAAPAGVLVEDRLRIRTSAGGGWWARPTLAFLPKAFGYLRGGEFHVDPGGVRISAEIPDRDEQRRIHSLASTYFPGPAYALASQFDSSLPADSDPAPTLVSHSDPEPEDKLVTPVAPPPAGGIPTPPAEDNPDPESANVDTLTEIRDLVADTQVYFQTNSTSLTLEERAKLDRVATVLNKSDDPGVFGISGFTDPYGNRDYNKRLSNLRCEAVRKYLLQQGVPASRLKIQQGGEITTPDTNEPSWKMRRVQFQWLKLANR